MGILHTLSSTLRSNSKVIDTNHENTIINFIDITHNNHPNVVETFDNIEDSFKILICDPLTKEITKVNLHGKEWQVVQITRKRASHCGMFVRIEIKVNNDFHA